MSILDKRVSYRPFEYEQANKFFEEACLSHWHWMKVSLASDALDWHSMTDTEKSIVAGVLNGFTITETIVGDYWGTNIVKWFPKAEIISMATTFAASESIHARSYNNLVETLGLKEYNPFEQDTVVKERLENLLNTPNDTLLDKARSLAIFSGFCEGVCLFSSFAILRYFPTKNKLKGVGTIIDWSLFDECFVEGTEILTSIGWVDLSKITKEDKIAQYNSDTRNISFVNPLRIIEKDYNGNIINLESKKSSVRLSVTPNHDLLVKEDYDFNYKKIKAVDLNIDSKNSIPLSGYVEGELNYLTPLDKFRIATESQGIICNKDKTIVFSFYKNESVDRFEDILSKCGFTYTKIKERENNEVKQIDFKVKVPDDLNITKDLDWVSLDLIDSNWIKEFIEEITLSYKYRSKKDKRFYYSSPIEKNIGIVQAICALGGYSTEVKPVKINNSLDTQYYWLSIYKKDEKKLRNFNKTITDYRGKVRCVTVETGAIVVRYKNTVSITGNCSHSKAGCWLFNQLLAEIPDIDSNFDYDLLKEQVYEGAKTVIDLECRFIDEIFKENKLEDLDPYDLKQFIIYRTNLKLDELGYKGDIPLDLEAAYRILNWFDISVVGQRQQDFFVQMPTDYTRNALAIDDTELDFSFDFT